MRLPLLADGILPLAVLAFAHAASAATVSGTVTIDGRPIRDIVVYLESNSGATRPVVPTSHIVMDQRNLEFLPAVLPIVRGTTVDFTNNDDIQHNVFSPSAIAGKFDLGAYGPGATRSVTFNEPGEVLVLCNIHMEMEAHIVVLRDPYFALSTNDGRYQISSVPPGNYTAKVWHGRFLPAREVVVPENGDLALDLPVKK
ncbi:MAG: methylamine utilization protein [Deltaproteobacteria bacterium]|nr:methylamine utilization protein [Deltaproteobacteria bacterium]